MILLSHRVHGYRRYHRREHDRFSCPKIGMLRGKTSPKSSAATRAQQGRRLAERRRCCSCSPVSFYAVKVSRCACGVFPPVLLDATQRPFRDKLGRRFSRGHTEESQHKSFLFLFLSSRCATGVFEKQKISWFLRFTLPSNKVKTRIWSEKVPYLSLTCVCA